MHTDNKIKRVILCSGKVYFDLLESRRSQKIQNIAIIRVEQLYPWPEVLIKEEVSRYPKADIVWCQEEASNQGAWEFINDRLNNILRLLDNKKTKMREIIYVGREASASPASGALKIHNEEQAFLIDQALNAIT